MYPPFARIFHFSAKIVRAPRCDVHVPPRAKDFRPKSRSFRNSYLIFGRKYLFSRFFDN